MRVRHTYGVLAWREDLCSSDLTSELQSHSHLAEDGIRDESVTGVQTCDRKSTRLNSSHTLISYAVFCLDRKSVVQGKSVDLGGRRILKKKNNGGLAVASPEPPL